MSAPHSDSHFIAPGGLSLQGPHRVEAFALCPQLEAWAHELHLRSLTPKEPADVGVLWHSGLAYHYGLRMNPRPDWLVYADPYEVIERQGQHLFRPRSYIEKAKQMLQVYQQHYAVDDLYPALVEDQFVVYFENGEPYSCRTDLLAWQWVGRWRCVIVDHKGVGKMGNEGAKYHISRQMQTNIVLARAAGWPVEAVLINAQSRNPPFTPMRFEVPLNVTAYNRLGADTKYWLDQMKAVRQTHPDPTNRPRNSGACVWGQPIEHDQPFKKQFGACDYFGLCWQNASIEEFHVPAENLAKLRR